MVAATEEAGHPGVAGTEGFGRYVQWLEAYFYPENDILVSMRAICLQRAFDTLAELFDCVILQTNVVKTTSMAFQPCRALGVALRRPTVSR